MLVKKGFSHARQRESAACPSADCNVRRATAADLLWRFEGVRPRSPPEQGGVLRMEVGSAVMLMRDEIVYDSGNNSSEL